MYKIIGKVRLMFKDLKEGSSDGLYIRNQYQDKAMETRERVKKVF